MKMNKHYNELKASYLFVDIAHKVAAYQEAHPEKEIIRLGIGDVTQPLAKCVVDAMHDAVTEMGTKEGFHGYGPEQGYPFLKQAIQGYYAGRGTKLDEDEIFISDGAKSDRPRSGPRLPHLCGRQRHRWPQDHLWPHQSGERLPRDARRQREG